MAAFTPGEEAARRRTFAIISHPDAGKTTLTENLLMEGGAIRLAGQVRARGENRRTRSDWMKIERERGISVSASVMTFEHNGLMFNLLDTPGHEDFSEDTYRTLTAADSAVMVLDAAKGIEPQTRKLFEVCRLRDIPITTFINKMDREAQSAFDLIDEIQDQLALDAAPMQWPAGSGNRFRGVVEFDSGAFVPFRRPGEGEEPRWAGERLPFDGNSIASVVEADILDELQQEAELARDGLPSFDLTSFREGHLTPVYFGSALRRFGVAELLAGLGAHAPAPDAVKADTDQGALAIDPGDKQVSGFVFKVQANMDPNHRDRIAFVRLASGEFKRGMKLKTADTHKTLSIHNPILFFAQDRGLADYAYPGDVIGVPNHGVLRVGDSLSETGKRRFPGIPNFAPEILRRARPKDPLKAKHLRKALESLSEEGVTQLFKPVIGADMIVGAVGALQIDVMAERIAAEYGLDVVFETAPYAVARWLKAETPQDLEQFADRHKSVMGEDLDGAPVFLAKNAWELGYVQEKFPSIQFFAAKERR
ncbi:MAG: peptide chain release factor 3 [Maricaulaceae bacterium]